MAATIRLYCAGCHPDDQRAGSACGTILGDLPSVAALRFAGLFAKAPDEPDGMVWLRCPRSRCGMWNRFRILDRRTHR
jgi:hypothetical protein